jgi:hypothetical protein
MTSAFLENFREKFRENAKTEIFVSTLLLTVSPLNDFRLRT